MTSTTTRSTSPNTLPWGQLLIGCSVPVYVMVSLLSFAPVLPLIRDDLDLSNAWAGMIGSAPFLTHTLMQIPGSIVPERLGIKRALELGALLIAIGVIGSGLAPNGAVVLLCRALAGIGTSISFISGLTFVNAISPPRQRQVAQGFYGAASNLGVLLAMIAAGPLGFAIGWRSGFMVIGALLLAVIALLAAWMRADVPFAHGSSAPWGEVVRQGHLYLLGFAHTLTYGAFTAVSAWAATFLWEQHQIGLEWAALLAAFLPASSVIARVIGGRLSMGREREITLLSCAVTTAGIAALGFWPSSGLAVSDLALVGWFSAMPFGAVFSYSALISGHRSSGRDLTLINFIGNFGALLFPPMIGYTVDQTGSFAAGFWAVAAIGLVGCIVLLARLPHPRKSEV